MASSPPDVPGDTVWEDARNLVRSIAFLNRAHHWLVTRASVWFAGFVVLYVLGGMLLGWSIAYELLVGLTAPAECRHPWYGYALSLAGWLLVPSVTGAAAGYLVTRQIERRRSIALDELLERMRTQSGGPPSTGGSG
ncbi:DUF6313 family protein [Streptomyces sp. NBC_00080]|uniref:DUF6313 family protein n=1 Tax=Streptomyces sp. NBC_00080 TaxID=2975645 RepID=UPI002F910D41